MSIGKDDKNAYETLWLVIFNFFEILAGIHSDLQLPAYICIYIAYICNIWMPHTCTKNNFSTSRHCIADAQRSTHIRYNPTECWMLILDRNCQYWSYVWFNSKSRGLLGMQLRQWNIVGQCYWWGRGARAWKYVCADVVWLLGWNADATITRF